MEENKEIEEVQPETEVEKEPETQAVEAVENNEEKKEVSPVDVQAMQYQYLLKLEKEVFADGEVSSSEFQNICFCKAQILAQLVSVEAYARDLPEGATGKKAIEALREHLYKAYDRAEKLREKAARERRETKYKDQLADSFFGTNKRYRDIEPDFGKVDDSKIKIALMQLAPGLAAAIEMKKLIENPSERIKSMMGNLLGEFDTKATDAEKSSSAKWVENLVTSLSGMTNVPNMLKALEGNNIATSLIKNVIGSKGV